MNGPGHRGHHHPRDPSSKNPYIVPYSFIAICCSCCVFANYAHRFEPRLATYIAKHAVCSLRNIRQGRYHTMITSSFMHFSPSHLAANMVSLYFIGPLVIDVLGPGPFLALWAGGSLMCDMAQVWHWWWLEGQDPVVLPLSLPRPAFRGALRSFRWVIRRQAVGASGSILGMATMIAGIMRNKLLVFLGPVPLPSHEAVGVIAAGSVCCIGLGIFPGISHMGNLGGMAFGAACYILWGRKSWMKTRGRRLDGRDVG